MARPPTDFPQLLVDVIIELYQEGYSIRQIQEKLNLQSFSAMTFHRLLDRQGVKRRNRQTRTAVKLCEVCGERIIGRTANARFCLECVPTHGWYQRYMLYGLTKPRFDTILAGQSGLCDMCNKVLPEDSLRVHVDHCHETGHVRGLLCGRCNNALGYIEDEKLMINAQRYLERHKNAV